MNVFITGGTGFIGKHTVAELVRRGMHVSVLSRQGQPPTPNSPVQTIQGDLATIDQWLPKLKKWKPEVAIHLAWEGIPDFSPELCTRNLTQSLLLYRALGTLGVRRVITSGSCLEYGTGQTGEIKEDTQPGDLALIFATKRAAHVAGKEIAKEAGYEFIWTRLFYVYGPGQRAGSLIPSLIKAALTKTESPIKNPGAQNDFIYVADVARALADLVLAERLPYDTFNIGSGRLTAVHYISDIIYGLSNRRQKTNPGFYANIDRMREIGWKPKVTTKEGIKKMMSS